MPSAQFLRFPVAFRSGLDGAPFRILSSFVLFYVVMPAIVGSAEMFAKYLLAIAMTLCFVLLAAAHSRINLSPRFPMALLLLSVLGGIAFVYSIFIAPGTSTFSSALIPLIGVAIPLLIATRATWTDGAAATEYLFWIYGVAGLCHVIWQIVTNFLGWSEGLPYYGWFAVPYASASMVLVYLMILSGLRRRNLLLALSIALIALSLLLRPSSTLAVSVTAAAAVIVSYRLGMRRLLRLACVLATCAILVSNLAALESDDVAQALYSIEPLVKEDALDAESNSGTRLQLISAARADMAQHSLLIGKAFTGNVTVSLYLPGSEATEWPIHSDFIIMIMEGGLIGYGVFASVFIGMALLCAKAARLAYAAHDPDSATLFDALQAMNLIFILCLSGNPMLGSPQQALPYLILVPLAIFLARAQPGFAGSRRRRSLVVCTEGLIPSR